MTGYLGSLDRDLILSEARLRLTRTQAARVPTSVPLTSKVLLRREVSVYQEPRVGSPRLGAIGGAIVVLGPATGGFVPVEYGNGRGFVAEERLASATSP